MKREQGVRDPVSACVVHGRVTLDRRCISFKSICMQVTVQLMVVSTLISHVPCATHRCCCLSHRHCRCRRRRRRRHLPRCCPERVTSRRSFILPQLSLLLGERRPLNRHSFLLIIYVYATVLDTDDYAKDS